MHQWLLTEKKGNKMRTDNVIMALFSGLIVTPLLLTSAATASAETANTASLDRTNSGPKLIIQITLDQFRADYFERFAPALKGGLKRILDGGFVDLTGTIDHAITNSYPGHASLSTGMYPASHGFSANEWWGYEDDAWTWIDGGADPDTHFVGEEGRASYSPLNLRATTLGEWVKQADPDARAISLAASEMAVAYAGRASDGAYWYDGASGRFVTSSYYQNTYPGWVSDFNQNQLQKYRIDVWENTVTAEFSGLAEPDDSDYENSGANYTFPHSFAGEVTLTTGEDRIAAYNGWLAGTPMRDIALIELAQHAINANQLGQRDAVDYLSITLSATDSIGHNYGGRSQEILDAIIRIDRALLNFIMYLDATLGEDGYVLAVSGDHGAPDPIEYTLAQGRDAHRITSEELEGLLDEMDSIGAAHLGSEEELIEKMEAALEAYPFVADAISEGEIFGSKPSSNPFIGLFRKSWVSGRIPDFPLWTDVPNRVHHPARYGIYVQFQKNTYFHYAAVVHGSPYGYDRTVPIMFYGAGVEAGQANNWRTIDVAPTLASLAGIPIPAMVDGKALH
jgi:Type I phosphodiesterase / nucleotide pyrophosphatase